MQRLARTDSRGTWLGRDSRGSRRTALSCAETSQGQITEEQGKGETAEDYEEQFLQATQYEAVNYS